METEARYYTFPKSGTDYKVIKLLRIAAYSFILLLNLEQSKTKIAGSYAGYSHINTNIKMLYVIYFEAVAPSPAGVNFTILLSTGFKVLR